MGFPRASSKSLDHDLVLNRMGAWESPFQETIKYIIIYIDITIYIYNYVYLNRFDFGCNHYYNQVILLSGTVVMIMRMLIVCVWWLSYNVNHYYHYNHCYHYMVLLSIIIIMCYDDDYMCRAPPQKDRTVCFQDVKTMMCSLWFYRKPMSSLLYIYTYTKLWF